ncbi:MAG: hypothetical protein M3024_14295 [Candidatus Dormibacteraeota bacterium]|nr:hypothetical protein [Candidatus Dormibacteraeota bacterium]
MPPNLKNVTPGPASKKLLLLGGLGLIAATILGVCGAIASQHSSPQPGAQAADPIAAPSTTPLALPAATVLLDMTGAGDGSETDPFATSQPWRLDYTVTSSDPNGCRFRVTLGDVSETPFLADNATAVVDRSVVGSAVGTVPWPASGNRRLFVVNGCASWHLRVTG